MENSTHGKILQYHLNEKIGSGFAGDVYHAWDSGLDRNVAVRIINDRVARELAFRSQVMTTALTARDISSPYVTQIYAVDDVDGKLVVVTEYDTGETLKVRLGRKLLDEREFLKLAEQLALGLNAIHKLGIAHKYVTSSNIILSPTGDAKLTDLGVAPTAKMLANSDEFRITEKLPYLAPEFLTGRDSSQASDQYSLGAVLYEALTGQVPFEDIPRDEIITAIENEGSRERVLSAIPHGEIYLLLSKMMAALPEDRFCNAEEIVASVKAIDLDHSGSNRQVRSHPIARSNFKARFYLVTSLAFFLLVLFLLIVKGFGGQ